MIYLTVFGGEYEGLARQALYTLRHPKLGNYQGRVVVFTDDPLLSLPDTEIIQYEIPNGDIFYWSCRARIDAGLLLDDSEDYIAYVDCDFIFQRDIGELFSIPDKLYYHEEGWPLWRCGFANAYLTSEEISEAQVKDTRTVNAGMYVIPGAMAKDFFTQWRAILDADEFRQSVSHNPTPDQSALNMMIYRKQLPSQAMPFGWIVQPWDKINYPDAKALHYAGKVRKQRMHEKYKEAVAELLSK